MRTIRCSGRRGCLPGRVCLPRGCLPYTPSPCEQNDRRLQKHYLAATTLRTVMIYFILLSQISRGSEVLGYVDAGNLETSNWLRFINAPRNVFEENVVARECFGKWVGKCDGINTYFVYDTGITITNSARNLKCTGHSTILTYFWPKNSLIFLRPYYQTTRDVAPGEELLVYYGKEYAKAMDVWKEYNLSLVNFTHFNRTSSAILAPCQDFATLAKRFSGDYENLPCSISKFFLC